MKRIPPTPAQVHRGKKKVYSLNESWIESHAAYVHILRSVVPFFLRRQSLCSSSSMLWLRWSLWEGSCAWWPGCCNSGWGPRWRSGRRRPPCCPLCGSAGWLWSWRAWRCCLCLLTSGHSGTGSGNTCRTETEREGDWRINWRSKDFHFFTPSQPDDPDEAL